MAYARKLRAAAERHMADGKYLEDDDRYDNAGYHFGLAAECALKGAFVTLGIRMLEKEGSTQKAYYSHFPALKTLSVGLSGRISTRVVTLLAKASFMQDWDVKMRYAGKSVTRDRCQGWRKDAEEMMSACRGI